MTSFAEELEIFRTEQETAQQYFFAYLGQRTLLAQRDDLLRMVNDNSLFWITSHHALIMSTFIAIGRIFDFSLKHNLGKLRRIVEANPSDFTIAALQARRTADLGAYAATYVQGKHGMTPAQWQPIADKIDSWTAVYVDRYKPIRHQFAHRRLSTLAQVNALLAKTNIDEMKPYSRSCTRCTAASTSYGSTAKSRCSCHARGRDRSRSNLISNQSPSLAPSTPNSCPRRFGVVETLASSRASRFSTEPEASSNALASTASTCSDILERDRSGSASTTESTNA